MIDAVATGTAVPTVPAPGWAPAVLTSRGVAYLRLAEFRDVWTGLSPADRAYFAETLAELLVDAATAEMALR